MNMDLPGTINGETDFGTIEIYDRHGTLMTEERRQEIARQRGLCYPCARITHEKGRFKRLNALTNEHVHDGICIKCYPEKVPKEVLLEWEKRTLSTPSGHLANNTPLSKARPDPSLPRFAEPQAPPRAGKCMLLRVYIPRDGHKRIMIEDCNPSDTIFTVKLRIEEQTNIPRISQVLMYGLQKLQNQSTIEDYAIPSGASLKLLVVSPSRSSTRSTLFPIFIQRPTGSPIRLMVDASYTIGRIKAEIEAKIDVPRDRQRLINRGRQLDEEEQTLSQYGITKEATLYLFRGAPQQPGVLEKEQPPQKQQPPSQPGVRVKVKFLTSPSEDPQSQIAYLDPSDTVGAVKTNLQLKTEQTRLMFQGKELDNDCTVQDCNIQDDSLLLFELFSVDERPNAPEQLVPISVEPFGINMLVSLAHTIGSLKDKVYEKEGFHPQAQLWVFQGEVLFDDDLVLSDLLSDMGLTSDVTFHMIPAVARPPSNNPVVWIVNRPPSNNEGGHGNQKRAQAILDWHGIPYICLDGSEREIQQDLNEASVTVSSDGEHLHFFKSKGDKRLYFGSMEAFEASHAAGTLVADLCSAQDVDDDDKEGEKESVPSVGIGFLDDGTVEHLRKEAKVLDKVIQKALLSSCGMGLDRQEYEFVRVLVADKCASEAEEREKQAILANPKQMEFYLTFIRKTFGMVSSCETLATGMVGHGCLADRLRGMSTLKIRKTQVGEFVQNAIAWAGRNVGSAVPFGDAVGSLFNAIVSFPGDRERHLCVAQAADAAVLIGSSQGSNLRAAVERLSRILVRARERAHSEKCEIDDMEKHQEFGGWQQRCLWLLGNQTNTLIKQEACTAADAALMALMKPQYALLDAFDEKDTSLLVECWASELLGMDSADKVMQLPVIEPVEIENVTRPHASLPPPRFDTGPTLLHVGDNQQQQPNETSETELGTDQVLSRGIDGHEPEPIGTPTTARTAEGGADGTSVPCSTNLHDLASQAEVQALQSKLKYMEKEMKKLRKEHREIGDIGGLIYADYREKYKDDVFQNKCEIGQLQEQSTSVTREMAILLERQLRQEKENEELRRRVEELELELERSNFRSPRQKSETKYNIKNARDFLPRRSIQSDPLGRFETDLKRGPETSHDVGKLKDDTQSTLGEDEDEYEIDRAELFE